MALDRWGREVSEKPSHTSKTSSHRNKTWRAVEPFLWKWSDVLKDEIVLQNEIRLHCILAKQYYLRMFRCALCDLFIGRTPDYLDASLHMSARITSWFVFIAPKERAERGVIQAWKYSSILQFRCSFWRLSLFVVLLHVKNRWWMTPSTRCFRSWFSTSRFLRLF